MAETSGNTWMLMADEERAHVETTKKTVRVVLTKPDAAERAASLIEAGGGQTNDYEVLRHLAEQAKNIGIDLELFRPANRTGNTNTADTIFTGRQIDTILESGIEARPLW